MGTHLFYASLCLVQSDLYPKICVISADIFQIKEYAVPEAPVKIRSYT